MRKLWTLFLVVLFLWPVTPGYSKWYKGNTHTHTVNSDGDSSPDAVARWYKEQRYNFVVITDHDFVTSVQGLNAVFAAEDKFLVLSGEEVSGKLEDKTGRSLPVHLNAINLEKTIPPLGGESVLEVLQNNIDAINRSGALAQINHPNFRWALGLDQMYAAQNYKIFEIANFSTNCNDAGGGGLIGTEALWDSLLTRGKLAYGVASDDTHELKSWGPGYSNPGRGWVWVRCDKLTAEGIVTALDRGDFYASTGVTLKDIKITDKSYTVEIEKPERGETRYTVCFIGRTGKVLGQSYENPAVYRITGREGYVRAKVIDSNGFAAWTQPVMTGGK
ncbi:MAG TPA: CehA/McbA family metallohydrolase [archaeon]|nr:CehA/McbA family metallohydrolase [archaeon]